jgi:hypothetical protein
MIKFKETASVFKKEANNMKIKKFSMYIVGQEKDGVYLIAKDDPNTYQTSIEMINTINNETKVLYIDENIIKVVSASLNYDGTILAYTTHRKNSEEDIEGKYESFLVEADNKKNNNRFLFNLKGFFFFFFIKKN